MGQGNGKIIATRALKNNGDIISRALDHFNPDYEFTPREGVVDYYSLPEKMRASLMDLDDLTNKKKKEYLAVYDLEGNLLFGPFTSNRKNYVEFTQELETLVDSAAPNSLIMVHTHPLSHTFSPADLENTLGNKSIKTDVVIVRGNIMYSYDGQELRSNMQTGDLSFLNDFNNLHEVSYNRATQDLFKGSTPDMVQRFLAENRSFNISLGKVFQNWTYGKYSDKLGTEFVDEGIQVRISRADNILTDMTYTDRSNRTNEALMLLMGAKNVSYFAQRLR
ncbi:MAG: hypothetical protein FWG34_12320 [Oscillospiraceae bacterium]|nr:hypothetical protein [Oscillospiraceae bacterium]